MNLMAGHQPYQMRIPQLTLLAARNVAKVVARKLNANVNYDLRMYEAIRDLRRWSADDVIFDVGANDGRTIFRLMRHLPAPRIVAFEPVSTTFQTLTERTADLENVERFRLALGSETGRRSIYLNESAALNSLYSDWGPPGDPEPSDRPTEMIDIVTLDQFVAQREIARVHLLKVDTEGHDLEVLKGAEESLREGRVEMIQVEAGFSAPGREQPSLHEIQAYLKPFDYHLYGIYNQCSSAKPLRASWPSRQTTAPPVLVYCDALFVSAGAAFATSTR